MSITIILANFGGITSLMLGLFGIFYPARAASFVNLIPNGKIGVSEIRATYGGFFFALGASALWFQSALVFSVLGFAWLSAAIVRLASAILEKSLLPKNLAGVAFEGVIGLSCLSLLSSVV